MFFSNLPEQVCSWFMLVVFGQINSSSLYPNSFRNVMKDTYALYHHDTLALSLCNYSISIWQIFLWQLWNCSNQISDCESISLAECRYLDANYCKDTWVYYHWAKTVSRFIIQKILISLRRVICVCGQKLRMLSCFKNVLRFRQLNEPSCMLWCHIAPFRLNYESEGD